MSDLLLSRAGLRMIQRAADCYVESLRERAMTTAPVTVEDKEELRVVALGTVAQLFDSELELTVTVGAV